jgi:RNA polymerase sigma-70 factor (ECF subfamily)
MSSRRYRSSSQDGRGSRVPQPEQLESFRCSIRLFAARRLGNWPAAEDVAQEALRRTLEALQAGRIASHDALAGFLFKTTVHICMHRGRSARREKRALERWAADSATAPDEDALGALLSEERRKSLRNALSGLEAEERRILELTYDNELDSGEIGRQLGLTAGTVRVRRHRAIRRLSELLGVTRAPDREFKS